MHEGGSGGHFYVWALNSEKCLDLRLNDVRVLEPDDLVLEYSLTVEEHRCGQALYAVELLSQIVGSDREWVADADLLRKQESIFRIRHVVEFESDDREP